MKLVVVTLSGRELEVVLDPTNTVLQVKEKIEQKEGIPPEQQRLVFHGKHIEDFQLLRDCHLVDGSRVNLVLSLKGGK